MLKRAEADKVREREGARDAAPAHDHLRRLREENLKEETETERKEETESFSMLGKFNV